MQAEVPAGIRIERDYDPSIPALGGDADQLIQAVLNVVRNAAEAIQHQGVITLRTASSAVHHRREAPPAGGAPTSWITVPASPRKQEQIFYPMISGRPGGTGLGLSIAQDIIAQHGGLIECASRPGETVFSCCCPGERSMAERTCLGDRRRPRHPLGAGKGPAPGGHDGHDLRQRGGGADTARASGRTP